MSNSMLYVEFGLNPNDNGLSLRYYQLNQDNPQIIFDANVQNPIVNILQQQFNAVAAVTGNQAITVPLCNVLEQAFNAIPLPNNNNGEFKEKLAVMRINGALTLGDNPLAASEEFNSRGITLAVVATAMPNFEISKYYRTLADYTGGKYMLSANAPTILFRVILSVSGENTLRQAFLCIEIEDLPVMANNINDMNEQNQIIDGVGELDFNHGLSQ